jgi:hypothetical protein
VLEYGILSNDPEATLNGLGYQHPVEWIAAVERKLAKTHGITAGEVQRLEAGLDTLLVGIKIDMQLAE